MPLLMFEISDKRNKRGCESANQGSEKKLILTKPCLVFRVWFDFIVGGDSDYRNGIRTIDELVEIITNEDCFHL